MEAPINLAAWFEGQASGSYTLPENKIDYSRDSNYVEQSRYNKMNRSIYRNFHTPVSYGARENYRMAA